MSFDNHSRNRAGSDRDRDNSSYDDHNLRGRSGERRGAYDSNQLSREGGRGRERRERSRSRSRDGERDRYDNDRSVRQSSNKRYREYDDDGGRDTKYQRRRSRSSSPAPTSSHSTTPTSIILMRGLSSVTSEAMIMQALAGFSPYQVRMSLDWDTNVQRSYCFIEFDSTENSVALMNAHGPSVHSAESKPLVIGGATVSIQYSINDHHSGEKRREDWYCGYCSIKNFAKRASCFGCQAPLDGKAVRVDVAYLHPGAVPHSSLLLCGLGTQSVGRTIKDQFEPFGPPVVDIYIVRDNKTDLPRGYAYVEYGSVDHATAALSASHGSMMIDGHWVSAYFARPDYKDIFSSGGAHRRGYNAVQPSNHFSGNSAGRDRRVSGSEDHVEDIIMDAETMAYAALLREKAKTRQWPLHFEVASGTYNFDSNTGFFFESRSCFYYDTKTKIYYDYTGRCYYMYDGTYGGFVPYTPPLPKGEGPAPIEELQTPNASTTSTSSFKGSGQPLGGGAPVEVEGGRKTAPKKIKKTFNDISKWNTLQTELTTIAAPVSSESQGQGQWQGADGDQRHISVKHITLEGGVTVTKVYCLLCRRKFTSMDHLKRHEALSQLHKDNLSKSSSTSGGGEEGGVLYRDRASERRALHGQEGVVDNLRGAGGGASHSHKDKEERRDGATSLKKSAYRLETLKRMEVVDPTLAQIVTQSSGVGETNPNPEGSTGEIPEDNIGSKLLGKMGWKKGEGLGATKSGIVNPVGVENANKGGVGLGMKRG